jgi:glycosyltransferase involved in cell wall biosynthesis
VKVLRVIGGVDSLFGGPSASAVSSAIAVSALPGVEVVVAFPSPHGATPAVDDLRQAGVTTFTFAHTRAPGGLARRWGISIALAVWLLRRVQHFDLIHAHGAWTFTSLACLLAGRMSRRPTVLTTHESLTDFDIGSSPASIRVLKRLLRRTYARGFDLIVVASELERRDTAGLEGRALVVPHPVAHPSIQADARGDGETDGLVVGFLGRIHPKKNLGLLIQALPSVPGARLVVAGAGEAELVQSLQDLARDLGVSDRVEWRGFLGSSGKSKFFRGIHLLAAPSEYECFGVAVAEAMAAGVPVVVSRSVGIAPTVQAHSCGFVIEPTVNEVTRVLQQALENSEDVASMGARARAAAAREYAAEAHAYRLHDAYLRLGNPKELHRRTEMGQSPRA